MKANFRLVAILIITVLLGVFWGGRNINNISTIAIFVSRKMLNIFTWRRVSASVWLLLAGSRCCESSSCNANIWLPAHFGYSFMRQLWSCFWIWITWIFGLAGLPNSQHHFLFLLIMGNVNTSSCCSDVLKLGEHISVFSSVPFPWIWDILEPLIASSTAVERSCMSRVGYSRFCRFWAHFTWACSRTLIHLS